MSSIHTDHSYHTAAAKGASAARTYETWNRIIKMSKRELAEIAIHLAALSTDEGYDEALQTEGALNRLLEEHANLRSQGIV